MNTGIGLVFFAWLIAFGFTRSRPQGSVVTSTDRIFVALVIFAALLPAAITPALVKRSSLVPWSESAAFFVGAIVVGCLPFGMAMLVYRWRVGEWWSANK
jgi:hypothetical protein